MGIKMLRRPGPGKNLCISHRDSFSFGGFNATSEDNTITIVPNEPSTNYLYILINENLKMSGSNTTFFPLSSNNHPVLKVGHTYVLSFELVGIENISAIYNSDGSASAGWSAGSAQKSGNRTYFVLSGGTADAKGVGIQIKQAIFPTAEFKIKDIMIEESSSPTNYEPYQEWIYYPGVTNEDDGTRGKVDPTTLNWTYVEPTSTYPNGYFKTSISGKKQVQLSGMFLAGYTIRVGGDMSIWGNNSGTTVFLTDSRFTTSEALKASLSGKYLYYQRATDESWTPPIWAFLSTTGGVS